jgi:hypothetical protein
MQGARGVCSSRNLFSARSPLLLLVGAKVFQSGALARRLLGVILSDYLASVLFEFLPSRSRYKVRLRSLFSHGRASLNATRQIPAFN